MSDPSTTGNHDRLDDAVQWLIARTAEERQRPAVPFIRRAFSISAAQACGALRVAGEREAEAYRVDRMPA